MIGRMAERSLYPLEIVVEGVPVSLQTKRARSRLLWKERVARIARDRQRETDELGFLDERPIAASIFYFPVSPMDGDIDNIVKPILDSLIGIAFLSDQAVERVLVQKFEPARDWAFERLSDRLALALVTTPPVVYVRIDDDLSWRMLR